MIEDMFDSYPLLEELTFEDAEMKARWISLQNNFCALILKKCKLSSEATSSLIYSLQSPNSRLLKNCHFEIAPFHC